MNDRLSPTKNSRLGQAPPPLVSDKESALNRVSMATPQKPTTSSHMKATPTVPKVGVEIVEDYIAEKKLREYRLKLVQQLDNRGEEQSFSKLLFSLGLFSAYDTFKRNSQIQFKEIAHGAPILDSNELVAQSLKGLVDPALKGEYALMGYFFRLWEMMQNEMALQNQQEMNSNAQAFEMPCCSLVDHQKKSVTRSPKKPDGVFYYDCIAVTGFKSIHTIVEAKIDYCPGELPALDLGQLADYALEIWKAQPTRVFVPIFFLHGQCIDLFLFTRSGYIRTELGPICYISNNTNRRPIRSLQTTLQKLWFFLTLPADKFGQVCGAPDEDVRLDVKKKDEDDVLVDSIGFSYTRGFKLGRPICSRMRLVGRCAHVLKSVYNKKPAVLKILWTPKDRITEGAVYAILHESNVQSIPIVYDSGILKEDVFGYRLEYLVMEDCGKPIVDFAKMGYGCGRSLRGANLAAAHVSQVSACLASAYTAGVLHRDISSGNITIDEPKNARIIDWGFAKVFKAQSTNAWEKTRVTLEKWHLDPELVVSNENHYDKFTGTPLYMSIQMLLGISNRGLIHDLESLFYVILHALSDDSDKARGFKFFDSFALASSRVGYLVEKAYFLKAFGVGDIDKKLCEMLNSMYSFLFVQKGEYIGGKLLYDQDYERHYSREFATGFMDKNAAELICGYADSDSSNAADAAATTKKRKSMNENDTENVEPPHNKRSRGVEKQ
ncbi:hypothetical protein GGI25_003668 [Coemansia spiralis]|uniref:Protein kinase domain-containing protein n=2 Tax=Coemansia TaxID=4863 RepID=A0A9W8G7K8_9FUNG|nr:hypothetical protein GGI25_003668 [Coemansia spiralis]